MEVSENRKTRQASENPDGSIPFVRKVADQLGAAFVDPPQPDLGKPYADSSSLAPIIFVLSPGSDPFLALQKFAQDRQKESAGVFG